MHTPGPWRAEPVEIAKDDGRIRYGIAADLRTIAMVFDASPLSNDAIAFTDAVQNDCQITADALLIAQAPELLRVLKGFVLNRAHIRADGELQPTLNKLFRLAEVVIAHAEGGDPPAPLVEPEPADPTW